MFGKSKKTESDDTKERLIELETSLSESKAALSNLETNNARITAELKKALDAAKVREETIRQQTEADLLLVSAKIVAKILAGGKPEKNDLSEQSRLNALYQQQSAAAQSSQYGFGQQTRPGSLFG